MKVSNILKEKGDRVVTLEGSTTLEDAIAALVRERIGAVVILDSREQIAGVFSERDAVRAISKEGAAVLSKPISELMTRKVVSCSMEDTHDQLLEKMTQGRFRHLPVVEGGRLIGIISIGDVVKHKIASSESEAEAMREYISTG
ncbi:MAG: CBS domain-containing protein [Hyphomicrobiales bacterium]|nr:CBS domain-containing protein [Hyphomicrobiales bacterium]MCY4049662.1 CBS domain-containing protein [Hyphomicrobiales bacterium]